MKSGVRKRDHYFGQFHPRNSTLKCTCSIAINGLGTESGPLRAINVQGLRRGETPGRGNAAEPHGPDDGAKEAPSPVACTCMDERCKHFDLYGIGTTRALHRAPRRRSCTSVSTMPRSETATALTSTKRRPIASHNGRPIWTRKDQALTGPGLPCRKRSKPGGGVHLIFFLCVLPCRSCRDSRYPHSCPRHASRRNKSPSGEGPKTLLQL